MYRFEDYRPDILRTESGGDYNALFGYQNRPGGRFENVRVTDMSISDILEFQNPRGAYGQYVAGARPDRERGVATPVGAYQIVGTTLRDAVRALNIPLDTQFTPDVQDRIARYIFETQGPRAWQGLNTNENAGQNVARATMAALGRGSEMNGQPTQPGLLAQGAAPQRPRRDIGNILDQLAIGFSGLSMNPNEAIVQMAQQRIGQRREERQTQRERNATAEWIRSQGRADLAEGIMSGAISAAQAMQIMQQPRRAPIEVDGRLVDPETFQVLYESPAAAPDQAVIRAARTEFTGLPAVRSFAEQTSAFGRVVASANDPSPAGDLALIFNYMKVLDPGSVVREGEFATAQNAGGIDERTRSLYNRLMSGERLTPSQREDFLDRSSRLYRQAEEQYTTLSDQYAGFARAAGLPVEQVIPDFRFTGQIPSTDVPPTPEGYSRQDWIDLWRNMTPEQRTAFMEAGR